MEGAAGRRTMVSRRIGWPLDYHREGHPSQYGSDAAEAAEIGAVAQAISRAHGGCRITADPAKDTGPVGPDCPRKRRNDGRTAGSSGKNPSVHPGNHGARSQQISHAARVSRNVKRVRMVPDDCLA